jgi:predicted naringenin-chalcone synthase
MIVMCFEVRDLPVVPVTELDLTLSRNPHILSIAAAHPPFSYTQEDMARHVQDRVLGPDWPRQPEQAAQAEHIAHLFAASRVERRPSALDFPTFYDRPRSTGERMAEYQRAAYALGRGAMEASLSDVPGLRAGDITDFIVVSCTGYSAPGLDILLARDLGMRRDVRRMTIGHMGCYGALVGLRQAEAIVGARADARVALLCVEISSLHFMPTLDAEVLTSFALFGDAAVGMLLGAEVSASRPELVSTYCAADFATAEQMSWTITDHGFIMGLSPRVPVTLRRNVGGVVEELLAPHGLTKRDIAHWIVHPGGPSILEVAQGKLELSDDQMALSWQVLREHGNCSSATVLLILDALLRSGRAQAGDWGVMMAFGPGLTLETCLLRF